MSDAGVALRELDARIAQQLMGLVPCDAWQGMNFGSAGGPALMKGKCAHDAQQARIASVTTEVRCYSSIEIGAGIHGGRIGGPPRYSTDLNTCRIAELGIERRGLLPAYVDALMKQQGWLTEWKHVWEHHETWRGLVLADAEMRCRAMLAALSAVQS